MSKNGRRETFEHADLYTPRGSGSIYTRPGFSALQCFWLAFSTRRGIIPSTGTCRCHRDVKGTIGCSHPVSQQPQEMLDAAALQPHRVSDRLDWTQSVYFTQSSTKTPSRRGGCKSCLSNSDGWNSRHAQALERHQEELVVMACLLAVSESWKHSSRWYGRLRHLTRRPRATFQGWGSRGFSKF